MLYDQKVSKNELEWFISGNKLKVSIIQIQGILWVICAKEPPPYKNTKINPIK